MGDEPDAGPLPTQQNAIVRAVKTHALDCADNDLLLSLLREINVVAVSNANIS
jgi:hypothetical protein